MNTSVQVKTHTNHSASIRNVENLRESEQFKNPHIEVLKRTPDYKFEDDVTPPVARADVKSENQRQAELRKINNKINTYSKRLEMFKFNDNHKKVESLTKQIADLQMQKEQLKELKSAPETRGKKKEKNYVELIFCLTDSNQWKKDAEMRSVLKKAFARMQKTKIVKQLEGITGALHLDQYSLHIHYLAKVPEGKTWDSILKSDYKSNPKKTDEQNEKLKNLHGRKVYKEIQNTFQKLVKDEILHSNLNNKHRLTAFTHSKGRKYLPLTKYKALNPLQNEKVEEIIKEDVKEFVEAPRASLVDRLNTIQEKEHLEFTKGLEYLGKFVENLEATTGIEEAKASNLEKIKEEKTEEISVKKRDFGRSR